MKSDKTTEGKRLYERARDELIALRRSNSEIYDRALMTLSSALLVASLSFIGKLVPLKTANYLIVLHFSWICFGLTIISTITSFIYGQLAIKTLLNAAERYYLYDEQGSYDVSLVVEKRLMCINSLSGIVFILGIIFSILFVIINTS